jgi:hypothetical protein
MRRKSWIAALASFFAVAGCTTMTKQFVTPPPEKASLVVVGEIDPTCTEWERDARRFQRTLFAELRASGAFPEVRSSVARTLPSDALVINGAVIDAYGGSDFQQAFFGFGGPSASVEIRVSDGSDRVLLVFDSSSLIARKNFDINSWSPLEVHNLMDDLAADAADSIIRWSKGEKVRDTIF